MICELQSASDGFDVAANKALRSANVTLAANGLRRLSPSKCQTDILVEGQNGDGTSGNMAEGTLWRSRARYSCESAGLVRLIFTTRLDVRPR